MNVSRVVTTVRRARTGKGWQVEQKQYINRRLVHSWTNGFYVSIDAAHADAGAHLVSMLGDQGDRKVANQTDISAEPENSAAPQ